MICMSMCSIVIQLAIRPNSWKPSMRPWRTSFLQLQRSQRTDHGYNCRCIAACIDGQVPTKHGWFAGPPWTVLPCGLNIHFEVRGMDPLQSVKNRTLYLWTASIGTGVFHLNPYHISCLEMHWRTCFVMIWHTQTYTQCTHTRDWRHQEKDVSIKYHRMFLTPRLQSWQVKKRLKSTLKASQMLELLQNRRQGRVCDMQSWQYQQKDLEWNECTRNTNGSNEFQKGKADIWEDLEEHDDEPSDPG